MRARTLLRISPGAWLAPVLVLLCIYYVDSFLSRGQPGPYAIALTASAITTLGFIAPICAALGAWEGGRLRRAGWWSMPMVRRRTHVAVSLLIPIVLAGTAAVSAGILWNVTGAGLLMPDVRPLIVVLAVVVAHTAAGFAAGLWVPLPVAVPGALLVSLLWMVVLRALDPRWLMMLNGETIELCCGTDTDLAAGAVLGPVVVAIGVTLAAAVFVALSRLRREAALASAALLGTGLLVGAVVAMPLGADPDVPRDPSALVCATSPDGVRACVWPEHQARLGEVADIAQDALAAWRGAGIDVPSEITEGLSRPADSLRIVVTAASTPADVLADLAYGMLPSWPACASLDPYPATYAEPYLQAWFADVAGMSREEFILRWGDERGVPGGPRSPVGAADVPPVLDLVTQVRAAPAAVQRAWVERNRKAMAECHAKPRLLLAE